MLFVWVSTYNLKAADEQTHAAYEMPHLCAMQRVGLARMAATNSTADRCRIAGPFNSHAV